MFPVRRIERDKQEGLLQKWNDRTAVSQNSGSRVSLCQGNFRDLYRLCGGTEGKLTNA